MVAQEQIEEAATKILGLDEVSAFEQTMAYCCEDNPYDFINMVVKAMHEKHGFTIGAYTTSTGDWVLHYRKDGQRFPEWSGLFHEVIILAALAAFNSLQK